MFSIDQVGTPNWVQGYGHSGNDYIGDICVSRQNDLLYAAGWTYSDAL